MKMEMKKKMEKKVTNIGLAAILVIAVFVAVTGIASAQTYNKDGNYIEGINVTVNTTTTKFNESDCCTPLEFLINNTLNESATSFNVTTHPGLTTNATAGVMANDTWFWVNASIPDTYWVNVSNNENSSEYVYFTVEYSSITNTTYNENGMYIEGINVSVNTSKDFNRSCINDPLMFQINNTLNATAANFSVANQSGLTTNVTETLHASDSFWVNATEAGTYCIKVFNKDNQSEYVYFTVEYLSCLPQTCEIKPETLNLRSKGVFTVFITNDNVNTSTLKCEGASAVRWMASEEDDGTYIVKFNRQDLVDVQTTDDTVTLTVTGELKDGTPFECKDTIRVINKTAGGLGHKFALGHLLDGVKKWGKGVVDKTIHAFGIADEAASQPDTTPPVPTNTMHIDNISMWHTTAGPNYKIYTKVKIVDSSNVGVAGATVYLNTTLPDGTNVSSSGDTVFDDGTVEFKYGHTKITGDYISTVTSVAKEGWTYNSSANEETSASVTVP